MAGQHQFDFEMPQLPPCAKHAQRTILAKSGPHFPNAMCLTLGLVAL